jgi:hypothetical protein
MQNLETTLKNQQKIISQLNDLLSLVIAVINKKEGFTDFEKIIVEEYAKLKEKIYNIKGTIQINRYNYSANNETQPIH